MVKVFRNPEVDNGLSAEEENQLHVFLTGYVQAEYFLSLGGTAGEEAEAFIENVSLMDMDNVPPLHKQLIAGTILAYERKKSKN